MTLQKAETSHTEIFQGKEYWMEFEFTLEKLLFSSSPSPFLIYHLLQCIDLLIEMSGLRLLTLAVCAVILIPGS